MNIVFLGPQGSGKGTQATLLAEKLGYFYFESGDFLRDLAKKDKKIDEIINTKGKLVEDNEMFSLIKTHLEEKSPLGDKMILDGYPRSVRQYELLKGWLNAKNKKIDLVVFLKISEKESLRRLLARRVCEKCGKNWNLITNPPPSPEACDCGGSLIKREDDTEELIIQRLKLYHENTKPLTDVFAEEGVLFEVDGERPIEVIFEEIKSKAGGISE